MSFTENPFKHVTVGLYDNRYCVECDSCGAVIPIGENPVISACTPIGAAHDKLMYHVRKSHDRTPEDFKEWS